MATEVTGAEWPWRTASRLQRGAIVGGEEVVVVEMLEVVGVILSSGEG